MDKKAFRPVPALMAISLIALYTVTRTPGFEDIRAVQFLLIFFAGVLAGLALGIVRAIRSQRS